MIRDHRKHNAILTGDLGTMLDSHPEAFDCLLYKAVLTSAETLTEDVDDVVGSIEGSDRKIDYDDPIPARAMLMPDEALFNVLSFEDGSGSDLSGVQEPMVLVIKQKDVIGPVDVPKQSIVSWQEYTGQDDTDTQTVTVYVLESKAVGRAPFAWMKHYCIPLLNEGVEQ